jgi:hypothetical protein
LDARTHAKKAIAKNVSVDNTLEVFIVGCVVALRMLEERVSTASMDDDESLN